MQKEGFFHDAANHVIVVSNQVGFNLPDKVPMVTYARGHVSKGHSLVLI